MTSLRWMRLATLSAAAFSAASAADAYAHGQTAAFCGPGGGCAAVASSPLGQLLGPWLPGLGLAAYTLVFAASLFAETRRLALWLGVAGGAAGLGLIGAQALHVGRFCELCLGVDLSAMAVGALSLRALRLNGIAPSHWPLAAWAALYVLAVGGPPAYSAARPEPIPEGLRALWQADKINVVEFSDFQCPFCRKMHPLLLEALEPYGDRVHLVRLSYPLLSHRHAAGAASAFICARAEGKADAMAHELFTREPIGAEARQAMAADIGLDVEAFKSCVRSADTRRTLGAERAKVAAMGMHGLPTVWIGETAIVGFQQSAGTAPYVEALAMAAKGHRSGYRAAPFLWVGLVALGLVTLAARRRD